MYYSRDHFWGPLIESRHLRGSIRRLVIKKTLDFSVFLELMAGSSERSEFEFHVLSKEISVKAKDVFLKNFF